MDTVLVLGMFDGVHKGHKALLDKACEIAEKEGLLPAAFTFSNHPCEAFGKTPALLTTVEERDALLLKYGMKSVFTVPFTAAFAAGSPEAFLQFLCDTYSPAHLVCGFNYTFGERGRGNADLLRSSESIFGFTAHEIPPVLFAGEPVSSTRIRMAVEAGEMSKAATMLGRPYTLRVTVGSEGTATTDPFRVIPSPGTYKVFVRGTDGETEGKIRISNERGIIFPQCVGTPETEMIISFEDKTE